ncbi:hypothetical protein C1645_759248 [Glomus cerebriforme]|uniref:Transposase putative helix-turn-helix domain-containing protein n=1 Tax=Glomus cerebriforme TaxID=658196 RepID=A0A397TIE4_9GLOM|nr:hypothetical protein C1645_759248 [Glomus cerebriforme]
MVLFDDSTTDEHELSENILAINTIFICKLQGRRAAKHRRERKEKKESINCEKNKKRKKDENINRILNVKLYPNLTQKCLLKRWMGLARLIYNTIIDYLQRRQFLIVRVDKNNNKCKEIINFSKIQFLRTIIYLKLRSKKVYDDIPNNIIDETVDEAVKNFNSKDNNARLKFKIRKDLKHTITIHTQNFSKKKLESILRIISIQ